MISYHPDDKNIGRKEFYFCNFVPVDTDDVQRIAKACSRFVVSPIKFRDGYDYKNRFRRLYRHSSCFVSSNWIGLDFDEGPSLASISKSFCDVTHVIGTTKSHQIPKGINPACDRFRVFLKLPLTIDNSDEYKSCLRYYVEEYEADKKCIDAARFFWPCREIVSVMESDWTIDFKKRDVTYIASDENIYEGSRSIQPWVKRWLEYGVPQGEKNNVCLKIGIWLTVAGFSHKEIVDLIMKSPIPNKHGGVYQEVFKTTLNGVMVARREREMKKTSRRY